MLQHCNISNVDPTPSPWPPAGETGPARGDAQRGGGDPVPTRAVSSGDVLHNEDALLQPGPGQGGCLPPTAFQEWEPAAEQPPLGAYGPSEHMLLGEQTIPGGCCRAPGTGNQHHGARGDWGGCSQIVRPTLSPCHHRSCAAAVPHAPRRARACCPRAAPGRGAALPPQCQPRATHG